MNALRFPAPIAAPLLAAGFACAASHVAHAATLTVSVNHSLRLPVAGRAASVVVGNASLADVSVVDSHTLFVTGKSTGSTDLTVVDPLGRTVYAADIDVTAPGGAAITVHRAGQTSEMACSPRCEGGQGRPTGMAAIMQGLTEMAAARQTASSTTSMTSSSEPLGAPIGLPALAQPK